MTRTSSPLVSITRRFDRCTYRNYSAPRWSPAHLRQGAPSPESPAPRLLPAPARARLARPARHPRRAPPPRRRHPKGKASLAPSPKRAQPANTIPVQTWARMRARAAPVRLERPKRARADLRALHRARPTSSNDRAGQSARGCGRFRTHAGPPSCATRDPWAPLPLGQPATRASNDSSPDSVWLVAASM